MSFTNTLLEHFKKTFDDRKISSSERKALKMIIRENTMAKAQRDWVISELFKIAETGLSQGNNRETMDWLKKSIAMVAGEGPEGRGKEDEVYFSPGKECLEAILYQINNARESIDICVFTISDDRISDSIIQRHLRGLPIRIISDNEKLHDKGSDIRSLSDARIPLRIDRTRNHMHHKFAIFDQKTVLTGSYNWTRSAERYNNENVLLTESPIVIKKYSDAFDQMWPKMEEY